MATFKIHFAAHSTYYYTVSGRDASARHHACCYITVVLVADYVPCCFLIRGALKTHATMSIANSGAASFDAIISAGGRKDSKRWD